MPEFLNFKAQNSKFKIQMKRNILSRLVEMSELLGGRLREFSGGYVNTDEGIKKEKGAGAHLTRNAGKYVGGVLAPGSLGLTLAGGYVIDKKRRKGNIERTKIEAKQPLKAKGDAVDRKEKTELESTLFLKEFARGGKLVPIAKSELFRQGYMRPTVKVPARGSENAKRAAAWLKKESKKTPIKRPRDFAEARDRDGEGRFASGNIPGADDFAIAQAAARKKKSVGALRGGALLARVK